MDGPFEYSYLLGTWWVWGGLVCAAASAVVFEMATQHRLPGVDMTEANDFILGNSSFFKVRGSPDHFDQRGLELLRRTGQIKKVYFVGIPVDFAIAVTNSWVTTAQF